MAPANPARPVRPSSILIVAPSSPAMMPSGRPKLSPQPVWTMGTIPRTRMPFMPKRTMVSVIDWSTLTPTDGAAMNSDRSSIAMMMRGQPALSTNPRILFMTVHLVLFFLELSDHKQTKLLGRCGWRQDTGDAAFVDDGDPVANRPVSYTHLRAHETRHDLVCRLLLEKKKMITYTKLSTYFVIVQNIRTSKNFRHI